MKAAIGVSSGAEVVCAALVVAADDGSRTVEHRTVSSDREVNTDTGDLVASAIELMVSLAPTPAGTAAHRGERSVDQIAVTYRSPGQLSSVRSALSGSHRSARLVPEAAAAASFFDDSGLIARYGTVAIVDIGATGTTVSIVDTVTGHVRIDDRTDTFGGVVVDRLVRDLLHARPGSMRDDRGAVTARSRSVKEQLSMHESAAAGGTGDAATIDRVTLEEAVQPHVEALARFTAATAASVDARLDAVALIGGSAHIPCVRVGFESTLRLTVVVPPDPDTVLATGAALLALESESSSYPVAGRGADGDGRSMGRLSGVLAGALVAGGLVLAYGLQALTPSDDAGVSPAGSAVPSARAVAGVEESIADVDLDDTATSTSDVGATTDGDTYPQMSSTSPSSAWTTARAPATPTLHPAPDLPIIPWPSQPARAQPDEVEVDVAQPPASPPTLPSPSPDESTEVPLPDSPGGPGGGTPPPSTTTPPPVTTPPTTTPPVTTPEVPVPTPSPTEIAPPTQIEPTTIGAPTTEVNGVPTSPELTPPPTVWTPPPAAPAGDTAWTESRTPESSTTVQSALPVPG
ncbi:MAG: Hsp70 family protein [Rhodococcus sp. (in: high G+C Gram-positive bacteria)]